MKKNYGMISDALISKNDLLAEYDAQHKGPPGNARKIIEMAPALNCTRVDMDFGEVLVCAERYAVGRKTYIVHDVVSYITRLIPQLDTRNLKIMYADLVSHQELARQFPDKKIWGDECDRKEWAFLASRLIDEIEKRYETEC